MPSYEGITDIIITFALCAAKIILDQEYDNTILPRNFSGYQEKYTAYRQYQEEQKNEIGNSRADARS